MKGVVFTEFMEMIENHFGLATVNTVIENSDLESEGVYTAVGEYKYKEIFELLHSLYEATQIPKNELMYLYGNHLFKYLVTKYNIFFNMYSDAFDLLNSFDDLIYVHVRRMYPDEILPSYHVLESNNDRLVGVYSSEHGMYNFAKALVERTFEHFGEIGNVDIELLEEDGTRVKFNISRKPIE